MGRSKRRSISYRRIRKTRSSLGRKEKQSKNDVRKTESSNEVSDESPFNIVFLPMTNKTKFSVMDYFFLNENLLLHDTHFIIKKNLKIRRRITVLRHWYFFCTTFFPANFFFRTYYEKKILVPVPKTGLYPKKLVYKFGPTAHGWQNGSTTTTTALVNKSTTTTTTAAMAKLISPPTHVSPSVNHYATDVANCLDKISAAISYSVTNNNNINIKQEISTQAGFGGAGFDEASSDLEENDIDVENRSDMDENEDNDDEMPELAPA